MMEYDLNNNDRDGLRQCLRRYWFHKEYAIGLSFKKDLISTIHTIKKELIDNLNETS